MTSVEQQLREGRLEGQPLLAPSILRSPGLEFLAGEFLSGLSTYEPPAVIDVAPKGMLRLELPRRRRAALKLACGGVAATQRHAMEKKARAHGPRFLLL